MTVVHLTGVWRKRAGVEPTKARLTRPAGFEDRPPHRGTISSTCRVIGRTPLCLIGRRSVGCSGERLVAFPWRSAKDVGIADAPGVADAIEELEDMDGDLAPAADFVAQAGGACYTFARAESRDTPGEVVNGGRGEVVVVSDGVCLADSRDAL